VREFAPTNARLRTLGLAPRAVYTLFLLSAVAGRAWAALLYHAGPGWTPDSTRRYSRGDEGGEAAEAADSSADEPGGSRAARGGPVIELPDVDPATTRAEPGRQRLAHPRSYRQILENTHQHLFMMPVMFLILAHLFTLTGLGRAWLVGGIGLGALGIAGHLAAPWLIRWVGGEWAWFMLATLGAMLVGLGAMVLVPLMVMWWPRRRGNEQTPS
jgi:hypothetical protein